MTEAEKAERDPGARERMLQATAELLAEGQAAESVTVRRIAERAGVGVGAINYYFDSKDHLLNEAVGSTMRQAADGWLESIASPAVDPGTRLRRLLKDTASIAAAQPELSGITIRHDLLHGTLETPALLLPMLRQLLGTGASELQLRLMAFLLVASTQVAFLRADAFRAYSGVDVSDGRQRDACLDALVDLVVGAGSRAGAGA